jgi:hypothetical protein
MAIRHAFETLSALRGIRMLMTIEWADLEAP